MIGYHDDYSFLKQLGQVKAIWSPAHRLADIEMFSVVNRLMQ